ncbi:Protein of unknown function [Gryllus bimaculatus]|nr:Protein of unknown function [Gryllus bimaculatus]
MVESVPQLGASAPALARGARPDPVPDSPPAPAASSSSSSSARARSKAPRGRRLGLTRPVRRASANADASSVGAGDTGGRRQPR